MMISLNFAARISLGALLLAVSVPQPGYSQDYGLDALQAAAESGDSNAQLKFGEALVFGVGGVEQDVVNGVRLLEYSALDGNIKAKASLGKILVEGYYVPSDWEKGEQLLQDASDGGIVEAQITLASALLWGLYGDADPARARALLDKAVARNSTEAMSVLGELLVGGYVLDQDVKTGQAMLEKAAAAGDAKAQVSLGSFLLYGTDLNKDIPRAAELFEEAAASGNGEGLERLGTTLMWATGNSALAEDYLRRAGELGRGSAWGTLAEGAMYGYLGRGSRGKFDGFAKRARDAGQDRVAVLEANRKLWGISMRASGPEAIEGLQQAAEAGNAEAAKFLIGLVRSGNRYNVRKEPRRARGFLEQYSDLLAPTEVAQLSLSIDAATARTIPEYKALAAEYYSRPELKSSWMGQELFSANPNFAVYLLQTNMKRNAVYSGSLNGFVTRVTLKSILRECRTFKDARSCSDAPMHPNVIGALLSQ